MRRVSLQSRRWLESEEGQFTEQELVRERGGSVYRAGAG